MNERSETLVGRPLSAPVWVLPGLGSSGPAHWQTLWERERPSFRRAEQRDWDRPRCHEWVEVLERGVAQSARPPLLVAHSLACLLVVHWAAATRLAVRGALLVAPPDPSAPAFPKEATGFAPVPLARLPFASIVVASRNDPYGPQACARSWASQWGSGFVDAGAIGHINADSGIGRWEEGLELLASLDDAST